MWRIRGKLPGSSLYHNWSGYYYHLNGHSESALYFKCSQYRRGCRGRGVLYANDDFQETGLHNHVRNFRQVRVMELRQHILDSVRANPSMSFRDIVHREGRRFPIVIRQEVTVESMRSAMYRVRTEMYPLLPDSLLELAQILQQDQYKFISQVEGDEEDNILARAVRDGNGNTHIIFISRRMREVMAGCKWLFADGHFASRPRAPEMSQIFNLATVWDYHSIPLGSIFMESRTIVAYRAVFQALRQLVPELNPDFIACDWEGAQMAAWSECFPDSDIVGCLWHYCRAIIKKVKDTGLFGWVKRSRIFRRLLRMCCVLPLLPNHLLDYGFFEISIECQRYGWFVYDQFFPFLQYLEERWLNHPFRRPIWSVFGCQHRTNNLLECLNRYMRHEVGAHHPNTYALIEALVRLEGIAFTTFSSLRNGIPPARARRVSAVSNDRHIAALSRSLIEMPLGVRFAVRNFLFYASNTVRQAYNDLIAHPGD